MALVQQFLASLRRDEEGQGLAEYALILALIAIVAIIALIFLGAGQHDPVEGRRVGLADSPPRHRNRRSLRAPAVSCCPDPASGPPLVAVTASGQLPAM